MAGFIAGTCGDGAGPPPAPAAIAAVSGGNQTGPVVQALGQPLVVKVTSASGAGVKDVAVTWTVVDGGGTLAGTSVATDRQGLASVAWTLGTQTGSNNNRATASVTGLTGSPVTFTASASAGPPAQLTGVLGNSQTGVVGQELALPLGVRVRDQFSNPAKDVPVSWAVTAGGGALSSSLVLTDSSGLAFVTWQLGPTAGTNADGARASVTGLTPVDFVASANPAAAGQLVVVSGNNQADTVGQVLPQPLVVAVRDRFGNPVAQVTVTWSVTSGGGSLSAGLAATDAQGRASVTWTLGSSVGTQRVRVAASGLTPVNFDATATPGSAAQLTVASGDRQAGVVGMPLATPFVVRAADVFGNSVAGVTVTWAVTAGNGSIAPPSSLTDAAGLASGTLTLGPTAGTDTHTATASASGLSGSPVTFSASGVSGAASQIALDGGNGQSAPAGTALVTPLSVRVTDGSGNGVADVDVGWAVTSGRGLLSAASSKTDATGVASVQWTLGPPNGVQSAEGAISGLAGSPVSFTATATPNATVSGTVTVATGFLAPPPLAAHAGGAQPAAGAAAGAWSLGFASGAIAYADASQLERFTPDELIVTFKREAVGAPAIGARAMAQGTTAQAVGAAIRSRLAPHAAPGRAEVTGVSPAILAARLRVPDAGRLAEVADALRGDPAVAVVERNGLVGRLGDRVAGARPLPITPTAAGYPFQSWHYGMVDLPEAWSITTGSAAVLVAVVDDGIRFDHPDIAANLTGDGRDFVSDTKYLRCGSTTDSIGNAGDSDGYDADPTSPASYGFDPDAGCVTPAEPFGGHGLHVAGTIGAVGSQVAIGVNWTVRIRPVRALGVTGSGSLYDVAQGILYAAGLPADNGAGGTVQAGSAARIINMSFGSGSSAVLQNAIVSAYGAGALLVASAGNAATSNPSYPAAYPEVLSVAAVGPDGQPASYSNSGPTIDLAAPGGDFADAGPGDAGNVFGSFGVLSTGWDFQNVRPIWFFAVGTSMAAPHVSGIAALLLARDPTLSRDELRSRLTTYAVDSGAPGRDDLYGYGIVNARNSLTQSFAPPQALYVRLYDASTGRIVQTVAAQPDGSYGFNALPDGSYHVFAGQDESGDGIVGVPGRRWGALGGEAVPRTLTVSGAGVYPASFTIGYPLEAESNSTLAQANVLLPGGYLHGAVDAPGSLDYLRVLVPAAGQYTFETSGWDGACGLAMEENTVLRLYDAGGVLITSHDDVNGAAFNYCSRITSVLAAGTYYLSVDGSRSRRYRVQARAGF